MIVRWKPLVILSGLFVVAALMGVLAMVFVLAPRANPLQQARAEHAQQNFKHAEIHYRQALQKDGKNAKIYAEMADMYGDWAEESNPTDRAKYRLYRLKNLADAAKYGKQLAEPRRELLLDALQQDDAVESLRWAKELLALEPNSADAHYVLALEAVSSNPPKVEDARRHLTILDEEEPNRLRGEWVRARLAQETSDDTQLDQTLARVRSLQLEESTKLVDAMALLRLRALDARRTSDSAQLAERAEALKAEAAKFTADRELSPARIAQLSADLDQVQKHLTDATAKADEPAKARASELGDSIEEVAETTFKKALESGGAPDLRIYQAYADHLLARNKRERCLQVVNQALKSPMATLPALFEQMMELRQTAIKAALADSKDPKRFELAEPFIKDLIGSRHAYYEGLGHLFQGAIDLEQSGLANGAPAAPGAGAPASQAKLRDEALANLQQAAEQLPKLAAAQALYGVGLILSQEPALGRQYLQAARKLGGLEPRYQIWAAWSMVQAGYPEEAEPIVAQLLEHVGKGNVSPDLEGSLHLLNAEIHQARRSPDDLKVALAEYNKAFAAGQPVTPSVELRLAQIDVMLGQAPKGLDRINKLRNGGQGGPAAEQLCVLTLEELRKPAEAERVLAEGRKRFPASDELVMLDAALREKAGQADQADKILADFLAKNPEHTNIALMRARFLVERLNKPDDARKVLTAAAETSKSSGPLAQLALLEIDQKRYDAAARIVARIRARWKDAVTADVIEAQMALAQGDMVSASSHFEAALKKDPGNKIVLLRKAELDRQLGASAEAAKAFEAIAREKPVKELEQGLSLATAAQTALASQALEEGDFDAAIKRLQDLIDNDKDGVMARPARWKLVAARAAKGQWPQAEQDMAALLGDPKVKPTAEERVQAANIYRLNKEEPAALAQLDLVLKDNPAQPEAVAIKAYMLASRKPAQTAEAASLLRKAIAASKEPPPVFYLMLAAVENVTPPASDGLKRALAAVDDGLKRHADSAELVRAKYRLVRLGQGKAAALAVVAEKAKADPKGPFRALLAEVYRDEREYAQAEQVTRGLLRENPKNRVLAATLVQLVAAQAIEAADRGDKALERTKNDETSALATQFRTQFPTDLAFPQAACELAARQGDISRGIQITEEMDKIDANSPAGPLLRARLYAAQGRTRDVAKAYREALARSPRQSRVRLSLAQVCLTLGDPDEALSQVNRVLEADPNQPGAQLIKAKALSVRQGAPAEVSENRAQALALLKAAVAREPRFSSAYAQMAEIQLAQKDRAGAIASLLAALKAAPDDANSLALAVQYLTEPRERGQAASQAEIQQAKRLAERYGGNDERGALCEALASGFHKAGQLELALPWAEKAATKLGTPVTHLTYGDVLLSVAEATTEKQEARTLFERAVAQYDMVLQAQANSIEAINNKAWILHRYLGNNQAALELTERLTRRADPSTLPGEFFDTVGSIQEALGRTKDAEESYAEGLRKAPNQPVLNFHMGRLLCGDPTRTGQARSYLEKAQASLDKLSPSTAAEVESLLKKIER